MYAGRLAKKIVRVRITSDEPDASGEEERVPMQASVALPFTALSHFYLPTLKVHSCTRSLLPIMALPSLPHQFQAAATFAVSWMVQEGVTTEKHALAASSLQRHPATAPSTGPGPLPVRKVVLKAATCLSSIILAAVKAPVNDSLDTST